jgi:hypothetical protein
LKATTPTTSVVGGGGEREREREREGPRAAVAAAAVERTSLVDAPPAYGDVKRG